MVLTNEKIKYKSKIIGTATKWKINNNTKLAVRKRYFDLLESQLKVENLKAKNSIFDTIIQLNTTTAVVSTSSLKRNWVIKLSLW